MKGALNIRIALTHTTAAAAEAESESGEARVDNNQSMLGTVLAKLEKVDEATEKLEQKAIDATTASRNSGFPLSFQIEEDK